MIRTLILAGIIVLSSLANAQNWDAKADFGGIGRHRGSGFSIGNKGYIGLGHMNGGGPNIVYQDWWQYDPASNSWTQKADYANGVPNYAAIAFSTSTKGYIGGGTAFTSEFFCYDPVTNLWTAVSNCPTNVNDQTAFAINDKGYVIDGNLFLEYDPGTDSWTYKQSIPTSCAVWSSSFVIGGSAFLKSGNLFYEYKASQDQWIPRSNFPGSATGGSSAFATFGKGYIVTGYAGSLALVNKEVWEFNPATNTWTQKEDFEGSARRFSVGFSINNRGYFGTGTNGINFNDFWAYDNFAGTAELNPFLVSCTAFPNPATESIQFKLSDVIGNETWQLQIVSTTGEIVHHSEHTGQEATFERGTLSNGTYFYQLICAGKTVATDEFQLIGL